MKAFAYWFLGSWSVVAAWSVLKLVVPWVAKRRREKKQQALKEYYGADW